MCDLPVACEVISANERDEVQARLTFKTLKTGQHVAPAQLAFGDAPPNALADALGADLLEDGRVGTVYTCLLVETGGRLVLIDTGVPGDGDGEAPLLTELDAFGIRPSEISMVILSHAHEDHLGGLLHHGDPVFTDAQHLLTEAEWQYWDVGDDPLELSQPMFSSMRQAAMSYLEPVRRAELLTLVTGEVAVGPGIRVLPAPGHTPGHLAVEVTADAEVLMYLGDALLHEAMVANPDWTGLVDADAATTRETRRALLSRANERAAVVTGGHLRGTGRVERAGDGYRWAEM
jgi:glyoxylase-like metal-dependent hydrolase (beta-lactamase superfamily II)